MSQVRIPLKALALISALAALYALFAMLAQGMLGGTSSGEVWWDRIYAWWVDFLAAGLLFMLAVYLWRRSDRREQLRGRAKWRVVVLPLGHLLLTGSFYFADFAWYLREYGETVDGGYRRSIDFLILAGLLLAGSTWAFWQGRKLRESE